MNELETAYTKLLGRQPNDTERQNLSKVKDALGLRPNDALWLVLIALQYHQSQYDAMPAKINKTSSDLLADFKKAADSQAAASLAQAQKDLAAAVASAAKDVARATAVRLKWEYAAGCIAVAFTLFAATAYLATEAGKSEAYANGYAYGVKYQLDNEQMKKALQQAQSQVPKNR